MQRTIGRLLISPLGFKQGVTVFGLCVAQEECNKWNGC
jgi:hypothetical protein